MMHHKNCGGELYIRKWTYYTDEHGWQPDYHCRKCGDFIVGDAQIQETAEELQNEAFTAPKSK